jgi:hypothetical protein
MQINLNKLIPEDKIKILYDKWIIIQLKFNKKNDPEYFTLMLIFYSTARKKRYNFTLKANKTTIFYYAKFNIAADI